jgi:PEP-CTERM motif
VWKGIDGSFVARLLQTAALALAFMSANAVGARATTVIGANGSNGANCDLSDIYCYGGNGGDGQSVTATGSPAVAYGGMGGWAGIDGGGMGSGGGGNGGSATADAEASAASGAVTAAATAVGGEGGWSYSGPSYSGDATASATATSGDVSVYSTVWTSGWGFENPGCGYCGGSAYAYASATALPYGNVAGDGEIVFGIVTLGTNGSDFGDLESLDASVDVVGYRGDLFVDGLDVGPGPYFDLNSFGIYEPGTYVISGTVPEPSTMLLLGFVGLGLAGYRRANSDNPTLALNSTPVYPPHWQPANGCQYFFETDLTWRLREWLS